MHKGHWREVRFENSRNQRLSGLYYTKEQEGTPALIVCHGFTGSKEGSGKALKMSEYYAQAGLDVFLFDFAGNGQSQGMFKELTLSGQIDDLNCAVHWCLSQGAGPILTMGRSFGGTTVIAQAAEDKRVAAVCTWAAPANIYSLFTQIADPATLSSDLVTLIGEEGSVEIGQDFFRDIKKYNIAALAATIKPRPLLVVHGEKDEVVPGNEAREIFDAAGKPKELQFIPEADHRFSTTYEQVWEVCYRWLCSLHLLQLP